MAKTTHFGELLSAFALDCLDQDEMIVVSEHLASCASCRAELESIKMVVDQFPLALAEATPPTALKGRLLAQISTVSSPTLVEPERSRWEQLTRLWKRAAPAWGAVALVLIAILGLANLMLRQQVNDSDAGSHGMRIVTLYSTDVAPDATGNLVISADGEYGTLVVDGLPVLDDAHAYQLWLIRDGDRTDGGVFTVNDEGYGGLSISSTESLSAFPDFGVTIEPEGGSPSPTGEKVLRGSL